MEGTTILIFLFWYCLQMIEPFTAHYVFALGVARFLACAHWIIQVNFGHIMLSLLFYLLYDYTKMSIKNMIIPKLCSTTMLVDHTFLIINILRNKLSSYS